MSTPPIYKYLRPKRGSNYRQLCVNGRIRAEILWAMTFPSAETGEFRTPQEVAADYGLPLEAVEEAIAYCEANPEVIESDHRREERRCEISGMNHPDYKWNPAKYRIRMSPSERARLMDDESLPG
jgi:hypothetical protein